MMMSKRLFNLAQSCLFSNNAYARFSTSMHTPQYYAMSSLDHHLLLDNMIMDKILMPTLINEQMTTINEMHIP